MLSVTALTPNLLAPLTSVPAEVRPALEAYVWFVHLAALHQGRIIDRRPPPLTMLAREFGLN